MKMSKFGFWVCRCQSSSTRRIRSLGESHLGTSTPCLGLMNVPGQPMLLTPSVWVLMLFSSNSSVFILIATLFFSLMKSFKLFLLPGTPLHLQGNDNFFSKNHYANKFSTMIKSNLLNYELASGLCGHHTPLLFFVFTSYISVKSINKL